jgi:hypothetical protein
MNFGFDNILEQSKSWKHRLGYLSILLVFPAIYFYLHWILPDFDYYLEDFTSFGNIKENVRVGTIAGLSGVMLFQIILLIIRPERKIKISKWEFNSLRLLLFIGFAIMWITGWASPNLYPITILLSGTAIYLFANKLSKISKAGKIFDYNLNLEQKLLKRIGKWFLTLIPLVLIFVIALVKNDNGYFINLWLFPVLTAVVLFVRYALKDYKTQLSTYESEQKKDSRKGLLIVLLIIAVIFCGGWIISGNFDPLSSERFTGRLVSYFNFDTLQEWGLRVTEMQAQFFAELQKYSYPSDYNAYEPIHAGISGFADPVVENDLSVPFGLIYSFGKNFWWLPVIMLIMLWGTIIYFVVKNVIAPEKSETLKNRDGSEIYNCNSVNQTNPYYFSVFGMIRIFCVSVLAGEGLWLLASYYGIVPFTGRLIYGLGQDSMTEVFETIILFGFMGLIGKINSDNQ